jgi:cytochrome c oxidase assembly protein subunit 11
VRAACRAWPGARGFSSRAQSTAANNNVLLYAASSGALVFGGAFMMVPLYQRYCQSQGQGAASHKEYAPPTSVPAENNRIITIDFKAHVDTSCPWSFVPEQRQIKVGIGETALAFYKAKNRSSEPTIGSSVYHMIPPEAGLYFNKIQCFCFEEQLLNPGEEVDMPIFFFVDPMLLEDFRFDGIDHITLTYIFFGSKTEIPEQYKNLGFEGMHQARKTDKLPPPLPVVSATA